MDFIVINIYVVEYELSPIQCDSTYIEYSKYIDPSYNSRINY